jgi:predicted CopG family antitoxin
MPPETTTVEVKHDTYRALDIRKDVGESFDDAIRRLIGQTGPGVGQIETDGAIEGEIEELDDPPAGATCSHYDLIASEMCGERATHINTVTYDGGEPTEMYLCARHAGESDADE